MSTVLAPQVGFAGTTTTHLIVGRWSDESGAFNVTWCGREATTVGYYQIGMAEVTCTACLGLYAKGSK